jgi:putative nucleotidyltransferase with HDIG domain
MQDAKEMKDAAIDPAGPIHVGGNRHSRRGSTSLQPYTEISTVLIERRKDEASVPWAHLRLPPFPQVAIRVLQLANKENVQLHQLSDLISSDAAFASEVLTIANSLLYAPRFPASSVLQAIAVLGANNLQGMCLTVGVRAYLGKTLSHPAMRGLWHHNLACALIAEQLASTGFMDKDIAYTSGVLHDIGRFALAVIRPKEYADLLATHGGTALSILEGERALFGWDHCEVGRQLIVDWKLPCDFETIVSEHHSPQRTDGFWGMAELIKVSCRMADAAGFAAFAGCETTPYPELLDELPARERRLFHSEKEALVCEVANKIHALE